MPRGGRRGRNSYSRGRGMGGSAHIPFGQSVSNKCETKQKSLDDSDIPEERYFLDPDAVSRHLFCPVCQEVFNNPYRAPCGHSYCKKCITDWLNTGKNCPVDRQTLNLSMMHHDHILENIIGDYPVACPWRPLGCMHVGPLCDLKPHKEKCSLNPKAMPTVMQKYSKDILKKTTDEMQERSMRAALSGCSSSNASNQVTNKHKPTDLLDAIMATIPDSEVENHQVENSSANDDTETDPEHLPEAPEMPSLRMRLYIGGNDEERSTLCNFLETTERVQTEGGDMSGKRRRLI